MDVFIPILIVTNICGFSLFILFSVSCCILQKHLKVTILVIFNGAVLVSESIFNLFNELMASNGYFSFFDEMEKRINQELINDMWLWTESIGRLFNVVCLGYAVGRYVMICGTKEWAQYHSWSMIVFYIIIAVLVEFSFPLVSQITNFDYGRFDERNTCTVFSFVYCLKLSIMIFGSILHT